MRTIPTVACWLLLLIGPSPAIAKDGGTATPATTDATPATGDDGIVDLDTMVVSGLQPGPGLWQVRRGGHVLWILGTQQPLPEKMEWRTDEIEGVIAGSQVLLESPSVGMEKEVGFFRGLTMLPTAMKARRDPQGRTLDELVGAADHARWLALKAKYIGRNEGIEEWRPVFAALELYGEAVRASGLAFGGDITRTVERSAKRAGLGIVPVKVVLPIDNPRAALKEFAKEPLDDLDCFRKTLDRIEGDLGNMAARANAWSVGDLAALRDLPYENQFNACTQAFSGAGLARRYGIDDLSARIERAWLSAAEDTLARHPSSVALLPIAQLLRDDGYLAKLRAKGYEVVAPGEGIDDDADGVTSEGQFAPGESASGG